MNAESQNNLEVQLDRIFFTLQPEIISSILISPPLPDIDNQNVSKIDNNHTSNISNIIHTPPFSDIDIQEDKCLEGELNSIYNYYNQINNYNYQLISNYNQLYYYQLYLHICRTNYNINNNSITLDTVRLENFFNKNILHHFPTFEIDEVKELPKFSKIKGYNFIYIPSKIQKVVYNYISKKDLKDVDKNTQVAEELIYFFLSKLNNVEDDKFRNLSISYLSKLFFGNDKGTNKVKTNKIISILKDGTKLKGAIIESDNLYIPEVKSYGYKLTDTYKNKGSVKYYFKSEKVKELYKKHYYDQLTKAINNPIANNLLNCYNSIELPSSDEIVNKAKELVKNGHKTKKGKILKFRSKKAKELDDNDKFSYIEDSIKKYNELTEDGYIIPIVTGENAGGRVIHSFSLMPSWIRNLCKMNGEYIQESDYSALHPNIAIKLYKGDTEYLTHQKVATALNIDLKKVKIAHLSFFNMPVCMMLSNPVYQYYSLYEAEMLEAIIEDKKKNGYTHITKQLFSMEVQIMSAVIEKLNRLDIYVGYVYDSLFCSPDNFEVVNKIMNETIKEFGVKTVAKGDNKIELDPIKEVEIIIEQVKEEEPEFKIDKQDEEMLFMILKGIEDFKEFSPRAVNVFSKDKKKDFNYFNRNWHKYKACANKYNLRLSA